MYSGYYRVWMSNRVNFLRTCLNCKWFYRLVTVLTVLIVGYYSLVPSEEALLPTLWDKAQHFIAYGVIACGVYFSRLGLGLVGVILMTVSYSIGIESAQYFTPERMFDAKDIVANTLGASMGGGISVWLEHFTNKRSNQSSSI